MMGRSHAASGIAAGLLVAPALGLDTGETLLFAVVAAGYALLPDLDHRGAYASRLLGPVSGLLCRGLRWLSAAVYHRTRGPRDGDSEGTHRHLSHTAAFCVFLGLLAAAGTLLSPLWGPVTVLGLGTFLAAAALGDWVFVPAGGAWIAGTVSAGTVAGTLHATAGWLGLAVGLGCLTHVLGDALTKSGCPIVWPVMICGERWFKIRPPILRFRVFGRAVTVPLRFTTAKKFEKRAMFPAFVVASVLLFPGVWPVAEHAIIAATTR